MKRISYGDVVVTTDERLADLVLRYATLLARSGSADTVDLPGRIGGGPVERVSMLVGPASQITAWEDEGPSGVGDDEAAAASADLGRRIRALEQEIGPHSSPVVDGIDDLDG